MGRAGLTRERALARASERWKVEEGEEVAVAVVGVGVRGRWDDFAA